MRLPWPGDEGTINFFAIVPAVPRIGEKIQLDDGKTCLVRNVIWKTQMNAATKNIRLMPNEG